MKRIYNQNDIGIFISCIVLMLCSCTKFDTPKSIAVDKPTEDNQKIKRKVLWINIDGAVGTVVQQNQPATIKSMLAHSKYTFQGLSDNRVLDNVSAEDPVNWTTLLTGMIAEKHKVKDDSYIPDLAVSPSNPDQKVTYYPNVIGKILQVLPNAKTVCITPWRTLNGNMLNNTYRTTTTVSDEETKNIAVESLETEDITLILVSFRGMLDAGKSGGFIASNTAYIGALNKIDGYVSECLQKIKAREDAKNEDWLVIITSDHGGRANGGWEGASKEERNNLCIFYYNHYSRQEMKGETLYGAYFTRDFNAYTADPNQFYGANPGRNLSVEVLMRFEPGPTGGYGNSGWERMISKRSWSFHRKNSEVIFRMEPGENGIDAIEKNFNTITNSLWHSYQLGLTSPTKTSKSYVMLYDGEIVLRGDSRTAGFLEDNNDLQIGGTGVPTPYYIAEMRIWDTVLDEKTYLENSSLLNIQPSHPQYKHLVGYWKFKPESLLSDGKSIKNEIEGKPNLQFNLAPRIAEFANTLPKNRKTGNLIMENTMVAPQILYWLNANPGTAMDGFSFLGNYNLEEAWRQ